MRNALDRSYRDRHLSVPSRTNEFRFRTSHFITNDGLNMYKITYFILLLTGNVRLLCPSISKIEISLPARSIPTEPKLLSLNGKLSVSDNQLFLNWYGKPISSLLRSESISVLHVTLLLLQIDHIWFPIQFYRTCSTLVSEHRVTQRVTLSWINRLLFL